MNKTIVLNCMWVAIATAAFVFGRSSVEPATADADGSSRGGKSGVVVGRSGGGSASRTTDGRRDARNGRSTGIDRGGRSAVTVEQYLRESDSLVANKMFADLLLELDADGARELFDTLRTSRLDGQKMGLFLEAWGKLDGAAAMEAVADLGGDPRRRGYSAMSVLSGWAATDLEGAKAHLASVENGWEKGMLMQGLINGLAKSDPTLATSMVLQADAERRAAAEGGEGGDRGQDDRFRGYSVDRQMEAIANEQMRRGVTEATSWAEGLPDGSVKSSAFDRIAEGYAREDPAAAAEWVKNHAGNEYAERAVREVAEELARNDPAAAATWIEQLPEETQGGAMRQTLERWTREDPVAAGEYLTAMAPSEVRDSAISSFARELDRQEPQVAAQWAESIADDKVRTETLESVARSWMRSNSEQATEWLPGSGLPAATQQRVIEEAARDAQRGRDWGGGGRGGPGRGR